MRILIVCSGNAPEFDFQKHQAFIYDQVEALKQEDPSLQFDYFFITGKGLSGYLACLKNLIWQLHSHTYHCIHAHVAMSALLANLQRRVPVVATFHGSDINVPWLRGLSLFVDLMSRRTIYISPQLVEKATYAGKAKQAIIPCGVDINLFVPRSKQDSRRQLKLDASRRYVLFSSGFDNPVKNYPLAKAAIEQLSDESIELLELKNYSREEVALLLTAVDVALLTSRSEGSPQFIKEALACNCPVVSTDVGDVRTVLKDMAGCYITSFAPTEVAQALRQVLSSPEPLFLRERAYCYDNRHIARQIRDIYYQL